MSASRSTAERQVLVEHLDVVAGVFLRGEGVELAADRVDLPGRCPRPMRLSVPLKSMCSTKWAMPLRASLSWREPRVSQTPIETRSHVRHRLGDEAEAGRVKLASDHGKPEFYNAPSGWTQSIARPRPRCRLGPACYHGRLCLSACALGRVSAMTPDRRGAPTCSTSPASSWPSWKSRLVELGAPRYHAKQIFAWIHKRGVTDFAAMSDLPKALRARLADAWTVTTPKLVRKDVSTDGTTKYLFELADGTRIESVFIPDTPAQTFCISSQVGCAMACAFCLTGKMGLARHLTAGEIVGQVRVLAHDLGLAAPTPPSTSSSWGWASRCTTTTRRWRRCASSAAKAAWRCRPGASRSRPWAWCRGSSGWDASRSCPTSRSRCTPSTKSSATRSCRSTASTTSRR